MKTLTPFIITAAALLSIPQFVFSQTSAMIDRNGSVSASGSVRFKNGDLQFSGNTDSHANFDAAMAEVNVTEAAPVSTVKGEHCSIGGQCYGASVDNESFEVRDYTPLTAALVRQPSSMDGRSPAKKIISILLDGKSYTESDGSGFNEIVQIELSFADLMVPDPTLFSVSLQHNSTVYSMVKGDSSNITITDFIWSMDHKSFTVSLNFNCAMRSWAYASTGKGEVNLKGKMSKIRVAVPGWITACK